ncbi:tRNA (adenosine(37)-N6)-threonylcarbamoyltransferase complex ATPase subunit type 1 TsaE [Nocardioides sp. GY 10113]|uniref:tRNA (adenosine(37)-N6)-threonylcarbamoyltransferase complex ATPase subunit type 1 TsaE n=1 Tax=Nocardioides sp. GY 10113 TaxID=2569761 RepID=UPI0010A7CA2C|nr:tRNA (adenosine(37)-N6)-threonylcarbamoyltransferase complex ATPase subunit type 1 TsaE [Nocardioides sp. GY 10113]TIC83291.1 tRNA (adenosine(37)-N6)-threonylcarbamoyltransferase complex ATPase subunit type 1 TsaE [Nocardioides sp. GY 10113]
MSTTETGRHGDPAEGAGATGTTGTTGTTGAEELTIRAVGPEAAGAVLAVVRAAFADRVPLDPPTDALSEDIDSLTTKLSHTGGMVAEVDGHPVAAVVFDPEGEPGEEPDHAAVYLRRFGVAPAAQGRGVARRLVAAAVEHVARHLPKADRLVVLAREELPATIGFWREQGFVETGRHTPYVELSRPVPRRYEVPTAEAMRELAERLATVLRAGDVLVLTGELGAGKTTFTQGLGAGLGVRGGVTSPTFVIARVHPSLNSGPALVHVDAYRLHGSAELDDLDLDTDLDQAVTVVEWGEGLAEALTDSPLQVRILRELAAPDADPDDDPRVVEVVRAGARWVGARLPMR